MCILIKRKGSADERFCVYAKKKKGKPGRLPFSGERNYTASNYLEVRKTKYNMDKKQKVS